MTTPVLRAVPTTPEIPPEAVAKVLRIVAGLHAGASRNLADQEMLVVGSGDDCDIVLADTGVAAHHALITLVGGVFTLRALDAPVRIEGKPLHPGDPVEVRALQRVDLGEAAIAFGGNDEAAWDAMFPAIADPARKRRSSTLMRRLPMIAAGAVLALAVIAVIAAFLPSRNRQIDVPAYLHALVPQHNIAKAKVGSDMNGTPTLSGTVETEVIRDRIQQQLRDAGVIAAVSLKTNEDLAADVREVFRAEQLNVTVRPMRDGRFEINGETDSEKFMEVLQSRAMADLGVKVVPGDGLVPLDRADKSEEKPEAQPDVTPVDIASVLRGGDKSYVVDSEGNQYTTGELIPGHGKLVMIGRDIIVQSANGELKKIRPMTAAELAARAAADFSKVAGGNVDAGAAAAVAKAESRPANEKQTKVPAKQQ